MVHLVATLMIGREWLNKQKRSSSGAGELIDFVDVNKDENYGFFQEEDDDDVYTHVNWGNINATTFLSPTSSQCQHVFPKALC